MGTNYYYRPCDGADEMHVGKSSTGWCFLLNTHPDDGIESLTDWLRLFVKPASSIRDEYGRDVSAEEMVCNIVGRVGKAPTDNDFGPESSYRELFGYTSEAVWKWGHFYGKNHAERGPHDLIRAKIDGQHCVGHGVGTWDLMRGEFS